MASNLDAAIAGIASMLSHRAPDKMDKDDQDNLTLLVCSVGLETARNVERIAIALETIAQCQLDLRAADNRRELESRSGD
jgi:hypothetical protein